MVLLGSATVSGSRYGSLNQDHVLTDVMYFDAELRQLGVPQCYIALVMDGHGMLGEVCASEAASAIMHALKSSALRRHSIGSLPPKEVEKILVDAFHAGHDAAMRTYEAPPRTYSYPRQAPEEKRYTLTKHSGHTVYSHPHVGPRLLEFGTTATAVLAQGRTLAVAHAGDSLVVIGREDGEDSYTGSIVTERHSGSHDGERERLERHPGNKKVKIRDNDGYITVPCPGGPIGTFSLAMTRALGHRMMIDYGVIPTPTVSLHRLGPQDVCIIAASDGLWEGLDAEQAVKEVCDAMAQGRTADSAAAMLCKSAVDLVQAADRRNRPDNTTAALIIFEEVLDGDPDTEAKQLSMQSMTAAALQGTPNGTRAPAGPAVTPAATPVVSCK